MIRIRRKWRAAFICLLIAAFVCVFLVDPFIRCMSLRHQILSKLDGSSAVRVVEHSSPFDLDQLRDHRSSYKEITFSTITPSAEQISHLRSAFAPQLDYWGTVGFQKYCASVAHHRIEIDRGDATVLRIEICFHCGELRIDDQRVRSLPLGWDSNLREFITSIGLHPDGPWKK